MSKENSKYPSTYYRVSLKALIRDYQGRVLLVQEGDDKWTFPGGGIEHDETEEQALQRELLEEAKIDTPFSFVPLGIEPIFIDHHDTWIIWIVYEVKLPEHFSFDKGESVTEIAFRDARDFKDADNQWERLIYKWVLEKSPR